MFYLCILHTRDDISGESKMIMELWRMRYCLKSPFPRAWRYLGLTNGREQEKEVA